MNKEQFFKAIDAADDKMIADLMQEEIVQPETVEKRGGFNFRLFVPCAATLAVALGLGIFAMTNNSALSPLSSGDTVTEAPFTSEPSENDIPPSETTDDVQTEETNPDQPSENTETETEDTSEADSDTQEPLNEDPSSSEAAEGVKIQIGENVITIYPSSKETSETDAPIFIYPDSEESKNKLMLPKAVFPDQSTLDGIKRDISDSDIQGWTETSDAVMNLDYTFALYYADTYGERLSDNVNVCAIYEALHFSDKYMVSVTSQGKCIGFCVVSEQEGEWTVECFVLGCDIENLVQTNAGDGISYMVLRTDGCFYMLTDKLNYISITWFGEEESGDMLLNELFAKVETAEIVRNGDNNNSEG